MKVNVRAYSEDPEEKHYAKEIGDALAQAGWKAYLDSPDVGYGGATILPDATGLFIAVSATASRHECPSEDITSGRPDRPSPACQQL